MQLAENHVGAVSSEYFGLNFLDSTKLIPVAEHKFTRFEWLFFGIASGNSASFNRRMANAVSVTKWLLLIRQRVTILAPDRFNAIHALIRLARPRKNFLKPFLIGRHGYDHNVNVWCSEWLLPLLRTALTNVA